METIYLATGNAHKVAEFQRLAGAAPVRFAEAAAIGGMPVVEESASTFAGNARLKATALFEAAGRKHPVLADDSGLEVDALGGAPGIHSARYAGPGATDAANRAKLLQALEGIPHQRRTARFRCALCLLIPDEDPRESEGTVEGWISLAAAGAGGFGYDPLFLAESFACTFAQLNPEQKDTVSHRARALRQLLTSLGV